MENFNEENFKLSKDLKEAAKSLKDGEVRFLVDAYYQMQSDRIRSAARSRSLDKAQEPHAILNWLEGKSESLENSIKGALLIYVKNHPMGNWLLDIDGIGPVISAGLLAHIDINIAVTAGHIWSFAGIDKGKLEKKWEKGQKRPWNAQLKTLCWKAGESFVKVCNKETALYGHLYKEHKEKEKLKNDNKDYSMLAQSYLKAYKFGKDTEAYKAYIDDRLPDGHIHARAKRFAVKIFLSHLHQEWRKRSGLSVPAPYAIDILKHSHMIEAA